MSVIIDLKKFILLLMVFFPKQPFAQAVPWIDQIDPTFLTETDDENLLTSIMEQLEEWQRNPIDLNGSSTRLLLDFRLINRLQYDQLIEHRRVHGDLLDMEELLVIPAFDVSTITRIRPFVCLKNRLLEANLNSVEPASKTTVLTRFRRSLEKSKGYQEIQGNKAFQGSPDQLLFKIDHQSKQFRMALIGEKDPGEAFFGRKQPKGFDFYSGFIQFESHSWLRKLIIGDFKIFLGHGLTFASTPGIGRTSEVLATGTFSQVVQPSASASEGYLLRGTAATLVKKNTVVDLFVSRTKKDATIQSEGDKIFISSINSSGLHRTEPETERKGNLRSGNFGIQIRQVFKNGGLGYSAAFERRSLSQIPGDELYQISEKAFQTKGGMGMYTTWNFPSIQFETEVALDLNKKKAWILQLNLVPDPDLSLTTVARSYPPGFQPASSGAFGENSQNQNEYGLYEGLEYKVSQHSQLSGYADFFVFPWLKNRISAPSSGQAYLITYSHRFSDGVQGYVTYKWRKVPVDIPRNSGQIPEVTEASGKNLRIHFEWPLSERFKLRMRYETIKQERENGDLFLEEIKCDLKPLDITFRYCLFQTSDYSSRIYAYEQDLMGVYSVPGFYGRGHRVFLLVHVRMGRHLEVWFKVARTRYEDRNIIGSGFSEIHGSDKTDLGIQCRWKVN